MGTITLCKITIFPIKSLDGVERRTVAITNGKLAGDREYAFFDAAGNYVNGKRYPEILQVRARYSETLTKVTLSHPSLAPITAQLPEHAAMLAEWMSELFQQPITLRYDPQGFPDDTRASGPTLIGTGTIEALAQLFHLAPANIRRRFRMNLELSFPSPLAEDFLVGLTPSTPKRFSIGNVEFAGVNLCSRCSVPPRDPDTGEILPKFRQRFVQWRKQQTAPQVTAEQLRHFYVLGINTRILSGTTLRIGDSLKWQP